MTFFAVVLVVSLAILVGVKGRVFPSDGTDDFDPRYDKHVRDILDDM